MRSYEVSHVDGLWHLDFHHGSMRIPMPAGQWVTLKTLLAETEEDYAHWLEKQLGLIDKIGLANYIQSQMG